MKKWLFTMTATFVLALAGFLAQGVQGTNALEAQNSYIVQYYVSAEFIGCNNDCCWTGYCCAAVGSGCTPVIH